MNGNLCIKKKKRNYRTKSTRVVIVQLLTNTGQGTSFVTVSQPISARGSPIAIFLPPKKKKKRSSRSNNNERLGRR